MKTVEIQVLDEIDRLLDGGFEGEIDAVMKPPGTCQTLCFSATISSALSRFLDRKLVPGYAEVLATGRGGSNVGGRVEHLSYATKAGDDATGIAVVDALEHYASKRVDGRVGGQAIVFTETKSTAERPPWPSYRPAKREPALPAKSATVVCMSSMYLRHRAFCSQANPDRSGGEATGCCAPRADAAEIGAAGAAVAGT